MGIILGLSVLAYLQHNQYLVCNIYKIENLFSVGLLGIAGICEATDHEGNGAGSQGRAGARTLEPAADVVHAAEQARGLLRRDTASQKIQQGLALLAAGTQRLTPNSKIQALATVEGKLAILVSLPAMQYLTNKFSFHI